MKKYIKLLNTFLCALLFVSCNWFNNDADLTPLLLNPDAVSFTVTGKLTTNGAMPENFAELMKPRTALATVPDGKTIQYKVILLTGTSVNSLTELSDVSSETTNASGVISYVIKYTGTDDTSRQYWLRGIAYYMDGSTEVDILVSPDTQLETPVNLKGGVFTQDLEMRPVTTGAGKAELTITLQTPENFSTVTITSDTTNFELDLSAMSSGTIKIKNTGTNISAGSYSVTVNFYKTYTVNSASTDVLIYQFDDVINIFNNLTTTVWVDNGNGTKTHLDIVGAGASMVYTCKITDKMLAEFNRTNFYVLKGFSGTKNGTFAEPFDSLAYAINYINTIGNSTTTYTIRVKENNDQEYVNSPISIGKKIKIEVYKITPGAKDGDYTLSVSTGITLMNILTDGELTLEGNGVNGLNLKTNVVTSTPLITVSGKMVMQGGYIGGSRRANGLVRINNDTKAVFEMYGGKIQASLGGAGPAITFESASNGSLKVAKKPIIYNNPSNVNLPAGKTIQVVGALEEGALIGVTTATPPTAAMPVQITTGYGYQTGGYNAGTLPGTYFRGDAYGVTINDTTPANGEAWLKVSGGTLTTKIRENITIDIDHTNASNNAADRVFTFTVTKDKGAVAPATSTDLTSAEGISYSYKLKDHTDTVVNPASPATPYYNTSANTLTFNTNLPGEKYKLEVEVTWQGNKYQATFDVSYLKVDVPSGCVAVMGSTWNSSTTLCAGDTDRQSNFFIANRHITIPNLIASDHEVTQAEYSQYMNFGRAQFQAESDRDKYPVYYVDWYAAIIYCNLRTLDDSTFGSTRDERLSHCAYSLNGEKDPEQWVSSIVSNSRITKSVNKFSYTYNDSANTVLDNGLQYDLNADGWRLPLDVEWEYLARGGNLLPQNQTIYSGSDIADEVAWYAGNSGDDGTGVNPRVHEIKTKKPNSLKIYDMSGNVFEWCWDWGNKPGVTGLPDPGIDVDTPITGLATNTAAKSVRGGCFLYDTPTINYFLPTKQYRGAKNDYNFHSLRVVRTVK